MKKLALFAAAVLLMLCSAAYVRAAWLENGTPVCLVGGDQNRPMIMSDGNHGAFMSWLDRRGGDSDIYVQHLDGSGVALWTYNGVAVCTADGDQERTEILPDEAGGIIVAWYDRRGSAWDIYAQRIDANGQMLWMTNGIAICTASGDQREPRMTSDGAGGAIIAWEDHRAAGDIYAQRIDEDGNILWTANGIVISNAGGVVSWPSLVSDGQGGAIIAWYDCRTGDNDIYAQRVDSGGGVLWTANGVVVCNAAGKQESANNFFVVPDGSGGAVVTWEDGRGGDLDIYAQRIDADGNSLWAAGGSAICTAPGDQRGPGIASDGVGGAIISWYDARSLDNDIYAQRIDGVGTVRWAANGVALCAAPLDQTGPKIATDGSGGAVVAWRDFRIGDGTSDIFAQRIDSNGIVRWCQDGEPVCFTWYTQGLGFIASDGIGGAIVIWHDYRTLVDYDVYAYRINLDYEPPAPDPQPEIIAVSDVPNDQGGKLSIFWENSGLDVFPESEISTYSVWRRLPKPGGGYRSALLDSLCSFDDKADREGPACRVMRGGYAWEWMGEVRSAYHDAYAMTLQSLYDSMGTDPGWQYFMVRAHTNTQFIFYDSAVDSGYSVDNLCPCPPQRVMAFQIPPPDNLTISWAPNEESDMQCYRLYRGSSADFIPEAGTMLLETDHTEAADPAWSLGSGYHYKLSACDVHGNESGFVSIAPDDIVATLLHSFSAIVTGPAIELTWRLSALEPGAAFFILRANADDRCFAELVAPRIDRNGFTFSFLDHDCMPGGSYLHRVDISDSEGRRILFETEAVVLPPLPTTLYQNHPNPFNPSTMIHYYLNEPGITSLDIYDISGRLVRCLEQGCREAGFHRIEWNGRDNQGNPAASGMYFYRLRTNKQVLTHKMVLVR